MTIEPARIAEQIQARLPVVPKAAVILGSGLGAFTRRLDGTLVIPYSEIDGFPTPTVIGHRGEFVFGRLDGLPILALAGRFHYYEGHPMERVVLPVLALIRLGVRSLLLTNAAGGVATSFSVGDLMLITDHLNLTGRNPLIGPNREENGPRFPDMSHVYDPGFFQTARSVAQREGIVLREGVYAWMTGPSYETPAEIRMLRTLGADAVGMSTVPEAIVARHAGLRVAGVSLITNMAAGVLDQPLNHEEVTRAAREAAPRFESLVGGMLKGMCS